MNTEMTPPPTLIEFCTAINFNPSKHEEEMIEHLSQCDASGTRYVSSRPAGRVAAVWALWRLRNHLDTTAIIISDNLQQTKDKINAILHHAQLMNTFRWATPQKIVVAGRSAWNLMIVPAASLGQNVAGFHERYLSVATDIARPLALHESKCLHALTSGRDQRIAIFDEMPQPPADAVPDAAHEWDRQPPLEPTPPIAGRLMIEGMYCIEIGYRYLAKFGGGDLDRLKFHFTDDPMEAAVWHEMQEANDFRMRFLQEIAEAAGTKGSGTMTIAEAKKRIAERPQWTKGPATGGSVSSFRDRVPGWLAPNEVLRMPTKQETEIRMELASTKQSIEFIISDSLRKALASFSEAMEAAVAFFLKAGHPPEAVEVVIEPGMTTVTKVRLRDANLKNVVAGEIARQEAARWHPMTEAPEGGGYVLVFDGIKGSHHIASVQTDPEDPLKTDLLWFSEDDSARTHYWNQPEPSKEIRWTYCPVPVKSLG